MVALGQLYDKALACNRHLAGFVLVSDGFKIVVLIEKKVTVRVIAKLTVPVLLSTQKRIQRISFYTRSQTLSRD